MEMEIIELNARYLYGEIGHLSPLTTVFVDILLDMDI